MMKFLIVFVCLMALTAAKKSNEKENKSLDPICQQNVTVKPMECCQLPTGLNSFFESCNKTCSEKEKKQEKIWCCVKSCVVNSSDILDDTGKISAEKFAERLLGSDAAAEWKPVVTKAISDCVANATAKSSEKAKSGKDSNDKKGDKEPKNGKNDKKCKEATKCFNKDVFKCTMDALYLQCPSSLYNAKQDPQCDILTQQKKAKCPCNWKKGGKSVEDGGSGEKKAKKQKH